MYVQKFADGSAADRDLLGGKGSGLSEMLSLGLPVPDGVTITTDAWVHWNDLNSMKKIAFVSELTDKALFLLKELFPNGLPLLSVRSGARVSMPGMMDTILNVGITSTSSIWKDKLGTKTALDCHRRFLSMYGETALGIDSELFALALSKVKNIKYGLKEYPVTDADLTEKHLEKLVHLYTNIIQSTGVSVDYSLSGVLGDSITAVFKSWNSDRAKAYRAKYGHPDHWGTAVSIQQMVFGNMNDESCSGVLFTRNPQTGEASLMGEFLPNAQGEDVVAGVRNPLPLSELKEWNSTAYAILIHHAAALEAHYRDMQDIEFTVENGAVYILQTRTGKRSAEAAFKIATDLVESGDITVDEALKRVTMTQYLALSASKIDPAFATPSLVAGIGASAGLVSGVAVFSKEDAIKCTEPCILIRKETTPDDFAGMDAAVGILTATGGATSHAAVVARGMDKACVTGATDLDVLTSSAYVANQNVTIYEGDRITIDGATGRVWVGVEVPVLTGTVPSYAAALVATARAKLEGGVIPVTSPDSVPTVGGVYVDATKMPTSRVLAILAACEGKSLDVEVDFIGVPNHTESVFLGLMGLDTHQQADPADISMVIVDTPWKVRILSKGSKTIIKRFKKNGWEVLQEISGWDSLMDTDISGFLDPTWVSYAEGEGVPVSKLVNLLINQGKVFKNLQEPDAPIERQLFDVMGGT